jgi:multidrug efflux system membrane fusion protein
MTRIVDAIVHRMHWAGRPAASAFAYGPPQSRRLSCPLLSLPLLLMLASCDMSGPKQEPPPPLPVKMAQAVQREVVEWEEYPGRIEAVESVDVRARVDGYLEKVNFKAGDRVKKGDLLFLIDPRPFKALLNHAQAELDQAKARLELAKNNLVRAERMYKAKAISEEEYDARSKGLTEAAGAVQSAEASVYSARLNLEFTEVRSPITGKVGRELITAGNLVKGGGADATLLTFIVSTDPVYVYVDVDERSALKYRRLAEQGCIARPADTPQGCMPAEMALVDEQGFPHRGYIEYESPRLTASTGTLTLRSIFPNPDGLLSPGLFARLRVPGSAPFQAVLLPDRAVATDLAQKFVWVVGGDDTVERRPVVLGPLIDGLRVIAEGLKPEEWIVVEGVHKLKPGLPVKPERTTVNEVGRP